MISDWTFGFWKSVWLLIVIFLYLRQIENEYGNVAWAYGPAAKSYINWAAAMATSLDTGVPWVMCQQADAPDPIVSFCHLTLRGIYWLTYNISWAQHKFIRVVDQVTSDYLYQSGNFSHLACYNFFSISFTYRLTLAMDFTVTNSNLILTRSQKCGLRIGVDGKLALYFLTIW